MEPRAVMAEPIIDERVIKACQEGDREAFRLLFETYRDRVYSIAVYSFAGDQTAAADVTQQVFLKLLTTISQFRGDSQFTTWLYRLVANACIDEQRKRKRFLPFGDATPVNRIEDRKPQERHYAKVELADSVKLAIAELNPLLCADTSRRPVLLIVAVFTDDAKYMPVASPVPIRNSARMRA